MCEGVPTPPSIGLTNVLIYLACKIISMFISGSTSFWSYLYFHVLDL